MFTLAISFDHFQFTLIHGPSILGSYEILHCISISISLIFFSLLKLGLSELEEIRTILWLLFSRQVVSNSL